MYLSPYLETQKPFSSKTRIKTTVKIALLPEYLAQKPFSSKTRIKTKSSLTAELLIFHLKNHFPVKQGLRLFNQIPVALKSSISKTIFQ